MNYQKHLETIRLINDQFRYNKTMESMFISVFSLCVCRVLWIFTAVNMWHNLFMLMMCYPVTWLVGAAIVLVYLKKRRWIDIEETGETY